MCKKLSPLLVSGGAGFIGSEFIRLAVNNGYRIIVVDKLTYAGCLSRLEQVKESIKFYKTDICSPKGIQNVFEAEAPEAVVNFAAETHVDSSIENSSPFIDSNVKGVQVILESARRAGVKRFLHVSTDEVYGEIEDGSFAEENRLNPGNPYAASKAAADFLISSYVRTYSFPAIILRPCNNYGPGQYREKLIPLTVIKVLKNEKIPVYGSGLNVREWIYVSDCARAVLAALENGRDGEIYNVGSGQEKKNIDTVRLILNLMGCSEGMIEFVSDRPGHDFRYSMDSEKIHHEIGWRAETLFVAGLKKTVDWYRKNYIFGPETLKKSWWS